MRNTLEGRAPAALEMLSVSLSMNKAVSTQRKSILLVEDDPAVRESIRLLLSIDRHTVTEAANGYEALHHFTGSRYDLVITDYLMPEMLGDELAQNIKKIAPAQPILIVTAYLEKLVNAGKPADAVLGKPVSIDDLRRAIAKPTT
jgi:CheY-like chemotaxis protein